MKLGRIQDVKVPLKVVLGETEKISLRDVAGIGEGTIIELDRLCGEPVDLVAAGEVIAKGEVVVIDENFGIRVTEIMEKEAGE
jgi:flagellar motor switch protein FliN/FliY